MDWPRFGNNSPLLSSATCNPAHYMTLVHTIAKALRRLRDTLLVVNVYDETDKR